MARTRLVLIAALVAVATLGGAAAAVLLSTRPAARHATVPRLRTSSHPTPTTVRRVLADLDRARAAAYADPVTGDPDAWAAPACACHAEDARRLRALARDGLALRSAASTLVAVTVLPIAADPATRVGPDAVDALVVDRTSAYTAVDRTGRAVHHWPASGPRSWRIHLIQVAGRWRIGSIARAP